MLVEGLQAIDWNLFLAHAWQSTTTRRSDWLTLCVSHSSIFDSWPVYDNILNNIYGLITIIFAAISMISSSYIMLIHTPALLLYRCLYDSTWLFTLYLFVQRSEPVYAAALQLSSRCRLWDGALPWVSSGSSGPQCTAVSQDHDRQEEVLEIKFS